MEETFIAIKKNKYLEKKKRNLVFQKSHGITERCVHGITGWGQYTILWHSRMLSPWGSYLVMYWYELNKVSFRFRLESQLAKAAWPPL